MRKRNRQIEILIVVAVAAMMTTACKSGDKSGRQDGRVWSEFGLSGGKACFEYQEGQIVSTSETDYPEQTASSVQRVDLGLPSGLKWADRNVGAEFPHDNGEYYGWGETEPYYEYDSSGNLVWKEGKISGSSWRSYSMSTGSSTGITKYCCDEYYGTVDNKTILEPCDDVAHVKLGDSWRMPTRADWVELLDNCDSQWIVQQGVKGRRFTSRRNGNSIFLPAAGYYYDTYLGTEGLFGRYWSSSLTQYGSDNGVELTFSADEIYIGSESRYTAKPVRPVTD